MQPKLDRLPFHQHRNEFILFPFFSVFLHKNVEYFRFKQNHLCNALRESQVFSVMHAVTATNFNCRKSLISRANMWSFKRIENEQMAL